MSEELKPCRFCQGINSEARFNPLEDYTWRVFCLEPGCRARGPRRETRREAIAAWNTRTPADARTAFEQAVQEAVEAALQQATLFCTDCGHPVPPGADGRGSCGHGRVMQISTLVQHKIGGKND